MNTRVHTDTSFFSTRNYRTVLFGVVFFMSLLQAPVYGQINVANAQTAATLAQKLAGQGVVVTDPVLHCSPIAAGVFTVVSSNLGLDSGIVLTTGRAASGLGMYGVNGPSAVLANTPLGLPGDASLDVLAGQQTLDGCSLEFDVIPAGDTVSVDYVFTSEEYISAVCGPYNDAFAFFISGPGIAAADNMAKVPGTDIPVTINSVNNGVPGAHGSIGNCTSMGPGSPFTSFYRDNSGGTTITHQGMTTVLRAWHVVTPCQTYHFKIVIADAGNDKYDSGVFLEAGSLTTGSYKVTAVPAPVPDSAAVCIKGCLPGRFRIKAQKVRNVPQSIHFALSGAAIAGVDYALMADSVVLPAYASYADVLVYGLPTALNGPKELKMTIFSPSICHSTSFAADSAVITIYDTVHVKALPSDTSLCRKDSIQLNVIGEPVFAYLWTPDIGLSANNVAAPDATTVYTVTAFVPSSACPLHTDTVRFSIRPTPTINTAHNMVACYNTSVVLPGSVTGSDAAYTYLWQGPGSYSSTMPQPATPAITSNASFTLTVTNDTNGCRDMHVFDIALNKPDPPQVNNPYYYCKDVSPAAPIPVYGHDAKWYDSSAAALAGTPVPPIDNVATYTYYVADAVAGCEGPKVPVMVMVEKCCDGDVFMPTAFTPNNDGLNDHYHPVPGFSYTIRSLEIYNRWGQVVYSSTEGNWDGRFGGTDAPVGTYFYKVSFSCILGGIYQRTGDFILVR